MRSPCRRSHSLVSTLLLCIAAPLCCACLCGGSKNEDVDEVSRVLTETSQHGRTATITYRRTNRPYKNHLGPSLELFPDRSYVITEALWLTSLPETSRYTLTVTSNREGKVRLPNPGAELLLSPTADRVAYKLDDGLWHILFLVNDETWLRAPPTLSSKTPPDWSAIPTLPDYALDMYLQHSSTGGDLTYSMANGPVLLAHIKSTQGEAAMIDLMFQIKDHPKNPNSYFMVDAIKTLSEEGKLALQKKLVHITLAHDPPRFEDINLMLDHVDIASPLLSDHILRLATFYASHDAKPQLYSSKAASLLLLQASRQDIDAGRALAEALLTTYRPQLSKPGKEGWLLRTTALTIIATSGKPSAIVPRMLPQDPCQYGYIKEQGGPISREVATQAITEEFTKGPLKTTYHRPQLDGHFVLGAMYMTGQPLPESLRTLTCPKGDLTTP
jgi:hypothetical protein